MKGVRRQAVQAGASWIAFLCSIVLLSGAADGRAASLPVTTPLGAYSEFMQAPARLATAAAGQVYVTDPAAGQVVVFDVFGRVVSVHRGLAGPLGIAVDSGGRIYLGEEKTGSVAVFDAQWNLLHKLGRGNGEFTLPNAIAVDPSSGNNTVYVSDSRANQIKVYTNGAFAFRFGSRGTEVGQFDFPAGLFVSADGEIFVVDQNNDRVQVFDRSGAYLREFTLVTRLGGMGLGSSGGRSAGITGDGAGRLYVADTFQSVVRVFDMYGRYLSKIGGLGEGPGQFRSPIGVAFDAFNRLFVASVNNSRVEMIGVDSFFHLRAAPARPIVAEATDVTFSVFAGGTGPFTYQWRKGTTILSEGGNIAGATTSTLSLGGVSTGDNGLYAVAVSGQSGTWISPEAPLTVLAPPAITHQPASQTVVLSCRATFSVVATGGAPLRYQWRKDGADLDGQTNEVLTLVQAQDSDAGSYSVLVANPVGSVASTGARLTLDRAPVVSDGTIQRAPGSTGQLRVADLLANTMDTDGDPLSLASVSATSGAGGTVLWVGGWIYYNPPPGYTNADTFTYTVGDGRGGVTVGTVTVEVPGSSTESRILAIRSLGGGVFPMIFSGVPGRTYRIESAQDLSAADWQTLTNATADSSGFYEYVDTPPAGAPARFYRSVYP